MSKENSGALFHNDRKTADNHPDWKGKINVAGTEWEVAAWKGATRNGDEYLSLKVSPLRPRRQANQEPEERATPPAKSGGDIPF